MTGQLRVGAHVRATTGRLGLLEALIVDPTVGRVTHLVVGDAAVGPRRLVPEHHVAEATPDEVMLDFSVANFEECDPFDEPDFNVPEREGLVGELRLDPAAYYLEPYATPADGFLLAEHERVPRDEVAIRRGAEVESSDGHHVGHVDEFLVDPDDGGVTHVVVRSGHLRKQDVLVPVRRATRFEDDVVVLDLTAQDVDDLPHLPVQRHRHVGEI